jgi:uncharacterized protein
MLYLDTSLLVAGLTAEPETHRIQRWLCHRSDPLSVSDWVVAEFSAALSIKLRTGQIDNMQRARSLSLFSIFCQERAEVLPVAGAAFRLAASFADQHSRGLRAGDALHLAIAFDNAATLCTLDRRLAEAAPPLGVMALLV